VNRTICSKSDDLFCNFLLVLDDTTTPYTVLKQSRCALNIGKIILVQMDGAFGSTIQDDVRVNAISSDDPYRQTITVTLYEDTTYRLNVQLDCSRRSNRNGLKNNCGPSQKVNVWIDFNDNGYDDGESRVLQRARSNLNLPGNTYNLELYIPVIDGSNTLAGPHRMRVTVVPGDAYQRECGPVEYPEKRDYTANIVPKANYPGKSCLFTD
jgi:hypothetical protein